jgi:tRNA nucleotidyltransferase (CCA-adding enzyme)
VTYLAAINFDKVLKDIKPPETERKKVKALSDKLIQLINEITAEKDLNGEAVLVGSVAKGTWLAGKADVDLFIKFPLSMDEALLKESGLYIGHRCIEVMQGSSEERYASHPYVTGFINGYEIDFVPCYSIKDSSQLKSAVDRTILHTEYIKKNLSAEQADEVLLLKRFMESVGTYGSEFKVGGFSGYLCELLVLQYGSFQKVLEAARGEWKPGYTIDLEKYGTSKLFNEPLVAVDPVDKKRNVAAALTLQKMAEFVVASGNFLKSPSKNYFYPRELKFDLNSIKDEFKNRGTKTFLLTFKSPDIPEDAVYPQIRKTEKSIVKVAEMRGFRVLGSDSWVSPDGKVFTLIEFETWKLPALKKHSGPFVWYQDHQERFLEKHADKAWIDGDRWVVEVPREYRDVESFFSGVLTKREINLLKFGKHIKSELLRKHEITEIVEFLESNDLETAGASENLKSKGKLQDVLKHLYAYLNRSELLWR